MSKKDILPYGAVRVKWEADQDRAEEESYTWSILKPADWLAEVPGGWRYSRNSPGELARMTAAREHARQKKQDFSICG